MFSNDATASPRTPRIPSCRVRRGLILAPLILAGCDGGVLDPKGPIGLANRAILVDSLAIMLAIVIPTILATFAFAYWFRASNTRAKYLPDFVYSGRLELLVWSIPLLTIMLLGGVAWIGSHDLDPAEPIVSKTPALDVQVVSMDWKWLFIYPDQHVASVNELVIPAGTPIHFALTSASVMSTFFVPQLGSMIYTMNGMATQLYLQADAPGTFYGESGHYNGDGFSDMHFNVRALPPDQFAAWVTQAGQSGKTLDPASYNALAQQSVENQPFTLKDADPAIFEQIVSQKLPPGPGPQTGTPDVKVSPRSEY